MNNRIQELAEQAEFKVYEGGRVGTPMYGSYIKDGALEKFAELIVRECQRQVEQYIYECGEIASIPDTVIMKHFGVEE